MKPALLVLVILFLLIGAGIVLFNVVGEKQIEPRINEIVKEIEEYMIEKGKCPESILSIGLHEEVKALGFEIYLHYAEGDSTDCTLEYFWASRMYKYSTKSKKWESEHY